MKTYEMTADLSSTIPEVNGHTARCEDLMIKSDAELWAEICELCGEKITSKSVHGLYYVPNGNGYTLFNHGFEQSRHASREEAQAKMEKLERREQMFR
jgi:hypothetical protein